MTTPEQLRNYTDYELADRFATLSVMCRKTRAHRDEEDRVLDEIARRKEAARDELAADRL